MTDERNDVWVPDTLQPEEAIKVNDLTAATALVDYWWAWCHVKRQEVELVYDFGCDSGYGSRILIEDTKAFVQGFDGDTAALAYARGEYHQPSRNSFKRVDFDMGWAEILHNMAPQLIIAFDLLEKLKHRELFLEQVTEALDKGGWFFLSSWNLRPVTGHRGKKPYRVGYSRSDLKHLLMRYFKEVFTLQDEGFPEAHYLEKMDEVVAAQEEFAHKNQGFTFGTHLFACHLPIKF